MESQYNSRSDSLLYKSPPTLSATLLSNPLGFFGTLRACLVVYDEGMVARGFAKVFDKLSRFFDFVYLSVPSKQRGERHGIHASTDSEACSGPSVTAILSYGPARTQRPSITMPEIVLKRITATKGAEGFIEFCTCNRQARGRAVSPGSTPWRNKGALPQLENIASQHVCRGIEQQSIQQGNRLQEQEKLSAVRNSRVAVNALSRGLEA
jgi:hypothetical protein